MPYCPNCGKEVDEGAKFCGSCGYSISGKEQKVEAGKGEVKVEKKEERNVFSPSNPEADWTDALSALRVGANIIVAKPAMLLPALIGAVISAALSIAANRFFIPLGILAFNSLNIGLFFVGLVLTIVGGIISYIMTFASLDMARNAYLNKELNISKSISYVIKRILTFFIVSIVGAILAITVILIPLVILMFIIIVVDEVGLTDSLSRAAKFLSDRLVEVIILVAIGVVGSIILGLIPLIGSVLVVAFNILIALAYIDVYFRYKKGQ